MKDGDRNETQGVAGNEPATKELPVRSNDLAQVVTSIPLMQVSLRKTAHIRWHAARVQTRASANLLAPPGLFAAGEGESRGGGGGVGATESFNPLSGRRLQSGGRHPPHRRRTIDRDRFPFPPLPPPSPAFGTIPRHANLAKRQLTYFFSFFFFFHAYCLRCLCPSHIYSLVSYRLYNPNIINYTDTSNCVFVFTCECMSAR